MAVFKRLDAARRFVRSDENKKGGRKDKKKVKTKAGKTAAIGAGAAGATYAAKKIRDA